jgi:phosphate transport system substrate-binding protein
MKRTIISAATVLGLFMALAYAKSTVITVMGSDTLVILAQRWAEAYMASHPDATIQVTGGGSGTGISALINGTTDICNASRPMKMSEREKLKQRFNSLGVEIKAARDGLSVYVNDANPVKTLSLAQLKAVYTGEVTNWKELGGSDSKIIVYGRENSSGTYVYFRDFVLKGKDYTALMQSMPGTAAVVNAVAKDKNGIGYGGAAYASGVCFMAVRKENNGEGFEPTLENIQNGKYPITRYLYMYVRSKPTGVMKEYIDWILSSEGQEMASKVGYFPVK